MTKAAGLRAEGSGEIIDSTVVVMNDINNASENISSINGVIDEIALQTIFFTLNAAVEVARAGDSGRGFALVASDVLVASEMRSVAGRCTVTASEIKDLITDSNQNFELGNELANRSRGTLTEIVAEIKRISDVGNEISAASEKKSVGVDQVSVTINAMNQIINTPHWLISS